MKTIIYDTNNPKIQYLMATDIKLSQLISLISTCELELEEDGFKCLVKYIIGQQISDKARETLWKRMQIIDGGLTPINIYRSDIISIRSIGLSERKARCLKELSYSIMSGNISLNNRDKKNEKIITNLTSVNGIGRWTAEMYLIFSLGRENVLSSGDGTIRRVTQWLYELNDLPSSHAIETIFKKWEGYETIVSAYFWKAISMGLTKQPIGQLRL